MVDFIGVGAQKAGTSWIYACLYEHPQICAPIKELHFFSRPRFEKGKEWYESHFKRCAAKKKIGEFSTSYLYSKEAPGRIKSMYPDAKLIAVLRNPIERACSQYRNAIKAGEISENMSFEAYVEIEPSALEQGKYAGQIKRYLKHFDRNQLLLLVYEDGKKDPQAFIRSIYTFLEVDPDFVPSMLHSQVNIARIPRTTKVDMWMHRLAEWLRRVGLDKLVWTVRRSGIPDLIRSANTKKEAQSNGAYDKYEVAHIFVKDVQELSGLLERDLSSEWQIS